MAFCAACAKYTNGISRYANYLQEDWWYKLTTPVSLGDMMQFLTNDFLPSTPHKVGLNYKERYAFAYFHEPNFSTVVETLPEFREKIHYGTHFTNMFMRNYPERITAERIHKEGRMGILEELRLEAMNRKEV
jgi:hypothetical protein